MGSQVILATAGYDHTIKLWEATSGICYRTLQYADSQVAECTQALCIYGVSFRCKSSFCKEYFLSYPNEEVRG